MRKENLENFIASNSYFIWQNLPFKFLFVLLFPILKCQKQKINEIYESLKAE